MEEYKKVSRVICLRYALQLLLVVLLIVLSEFNVIPLDGLLLGLDAGAMYVIEVLALFVVGIGILASFKGYEWIVSHKVCKVERSRRRRLFVRVANARIMLLVFLMLLGVLFYYGAWKNWGMYYGLASLVASLFCLPSSADVKEALSDDSLA